MAKNRPCAPEHKAATREGLWVTERNVENMAFIWKNDLKQLGTHQHGFSKPVIRRLREEGLVIKLKHKYHMTPLACSLIAELEAELSKEVS